MTDTGSDAFGKPVPTVRQVAALDTAVEVIGVDPLLADPIIQDAARYVELDKPHEAMIVLRNIVDLTGACRLLAVMCSSAMEVINLDLDDNGYPLSLTADEFARLTRVRSASGSWRAWRRPTRWRERKFIHGEYANRGHGDSAS